jgi:hypothetical protein
MEKLCARPGTNRFLPANEGFSRCEFEALNAQMGRILSV